MTTYRVTMTNNSSASRLAVKDDLTVSVKARHNGGKVVIVECSDSDADLVDAELQSMHSVSAHERR